MDQGVKGGTFVKYPYFSYSYLFLSLFQRNSSRQRLKGTKYVVPSFMAIPDTAKRGTESDTEIIVLH